MGNVLTLFYNEAAWQQGYLTPWTSAHPFLSAAESGDATVMEQMLAEDGVDVNERTRRGDTALILAAKNGHAQGLAEGEGR